MKAYMTQIKDRLMEGFRNGEQIDEMSLLDMIYTFYIEEGIHENERIRREFEKIEASLAHLPFLDGDDICCTVNSLCAEYERVAFLNGIRTGTQLIWELTGE